MSEITPDHLEEKTLQFSVRVIRHCAHLKQPILQPVTTQLIRSATSIGANYAEANNAASKTDFRSKIFIAEKEAAETKYWLKLLIALGDADPELDDILLEAQHLLMILQKIINTWRTQTENGKLKTYSNQKMEN